MLLTQSNYVASTEERLTRILEDELIMESFGEVFYREFISDGDTDYGRILRSYAAGSEETKSAIDDTLMSLCGWSLDLLLKMAITEYERDQGESEGLTKGGYDLSGYPGADALDWFEDTILASPDTIRCCLHEKPRSFEWCQKNCPEQSSCDTYAWANDEAKLLDGEAWLCEGCGCIYDVSEAECSTCGGKAPLGATE